MTIYFDNAATTFPKPPCVVDAVTNCLREGAVNSGRGIYPLAQNADKLKIQTRLKIKDLLKFKDGEVLFSSSASLALNQIILGLDWCAGDKVYITPFEHNSVARPLEHLKEIYGIEIVKIPVNNLTLEYDIDKLEDMFHKAPPKVVVLTHVSNVCGLITPVKQIVEIAKNYESVVVIDGAQAGPLLPLGDIGDFIDFYVFSGHKTFYGPFGIAGFWTNKAVNLNPILFGGTGSHSENLFMPEELPYRFEIGSPNIVAIAGLNSACEWIEDIGVEAILEHERSLLNMVVEKLMDLHNVRIYLNKSLNEHMGTLSFTVEGYKSQDVAMILSQEFNISTRAGLHCSPISHRFLGTIPFGTVRISFGYFNTADEGNKLVDALLKITEY